MFSLQRWLGKDRQFCLLLEACAEQGCESVSALRRVLEDRSTLPSLDAFATARRKEKQLTTEIHDLLIRALVVALDREDISALASVLYRVPKTVEKFAERYVIGFEHVRDVDFHRQLALMERAVKVVLEMVRSLGSGKDLATVKQLNANIQKIESDADDLVLELMAQLYAPDYPALKAIIVRDLFELNEKVVDRCRDAGNVITRVALKNS